MKRKDLTKALTRPQTPTMGNIPHVFHSKGKLQMNEEIVVLPDQLSCYTLSEAQKIATYGVIAAGDAMVPYDMPADKSLQHSVRLAVSTRLMLEVGGHEAPPAFRTPEAEQIAKNVYHHAVAALQHYGTANECKMLNMARKFLRAEGYGYQASLLAPICAAAVDMAMEHRLSDLRWLFKEFHALYGSEKNPNPSKPKAPPEPTPKEAEPLMIPAPMPMLPDDYTRANTGWGQMSLHKVPMTAWKHPSVRSKKSWRYSEFGVFKYPWRALPSSDLRCFSLQRRQYGGTVLIDFSGSMSLDEKEVAQLLDAAPYATVAGYGSAENCDSGRLCVIAEDSKKGTARAARKILGGGNVVDGPALRWMAKLPKPRIWVSDGCVTGVNESQWEGQEEEIASICRSASIIQIPDMATLLKQINS